VIAVSPKPPTGVSPEVLRHHARVHAARCGNADNGCEIRELCANVHGVVCAGCGELVFFFVRPGTWCAHAAWLRSQCGAP
jgi:hypothetical protein